MNLVKFIIQLLKEMREQSANLHWLLRIGYYLLSFIFLTISALKFLLLILKPSIGNPRKRSICCGKRPESYEENIQVKSKPELNSLFVERGTTGYWERYYQCKNCGQKWIEELHEAKMGGYYELRKR